jgi:hypothetical protein
LQTERDKARVLEGLESASATASGKLDRQSLDTLLSGLGNRMFLLHNVHEEEPVVFQTRWALSYLRGPLTRDQIAALMQPRKAAPTTGVTAQGVASSAPATRPETERPILPPEIHECFWPYRGTTPSGHHLYYQPALVGTAHLHFASAKAGVDQWQDVHTLAAMDETTLDDPWSAAESPDELPDFEAQPVSSARFAPLRDAAVEALRDKYTRKLVAAEERLHQAQRRVEREQAQASQSTFQAAVSFGGSLFGALLGRKRISAANVSRAATSARAAGRAMQQRGDVAAAADDVARRRRAYEKLEEKLQSEIDELHESTAPDALEVDRLKLRSKKSEIAVDPVALVWRPYWSDGRKLTPAF